MLAVGFIGWYTPAVSAPSSTATMVQVDKLIPDRPKPDYEAEVLQPLYKAQQEARTRELAEQERQRQLERQREVQAAQAPVVPLMGECQGWMNQAGISDVGNAYKLIMRESGCNPNAVNRSSGACGIGQQLPCGKWPHQWNDAVGGMIDMQNYVSSRYTTWANAWNHEVSYGWY